jgi:hypothetical protein
LLNKQQEWGEPPALEAFSSEESSLASPRGSISSIGGRIPATMMASSMSREVFMTYRKERAMAPAIICRMCGHKSDRPVYNLCSTCDLEFDKAKRELGLKVSVPG